MPIRAPAAFGVRSNRDRQPRRPRFGGGSVPYGAAPPSARRIVQLGVASKVVMLPPRAPQGHGQCVSCYIILRFLRLGHGCCLEYRKVGWIITRRQGALTSTEGAVGLGSSFRSCVVARNMR